MEDHLILRQAIRTYFGAKDDFVIEYEASNGQEALAVLARHQVDIIVTDINMPLMNGIELVEEIKSRKLDHKILVLSMLSENEHVNKMISLGVNGYILKSSGKEELFTALNEIRNGNNYFSQKIASKLAEVVANKKEKKILSPIDYITKREIEIIDLILKDKTNKEISEELFISERTVGTHKRNIMEKTNCKSLAGLAVFAIENNLFALRNSD